MRIPSLLIAISVLGASAWAQEQEEKPDFYLQFGLGFVGSEDATGVPGGTVGFDPGYGVSLAVGYDMELDENFSFAPEFELYYQGFRVDENDLPKIPSAVEEDAKTFALMVNGTLDWHVTKQFSWYAGVGVGWATVIDYAAWDSGNLSLQDTSGLAGQVKLGVAYNMGGSYDFRLGLRYFKTEPVDVEDAITGDVDEIDVGQVAVEASVRWGLFPFGR
jgi:opacity protein-like surface antigen